MRHEYDTSGAPGRSGLSVQDVIKQVQAQTFGDQRAAQNVYSKPDPEQPLVQQAIDRLSCISGKLAGANVRISTVVERVLGPWPVSAEPKADGGVAGSAEALLGLIDRLARQVEDLHDVASRVERIG